MKADLERQVVPGTDVDHVGDISRSLHEAFVSPFGYGTAIVALGTNRDKPVFAAILASHYLNPPKQSRAWPWRRAYLLGSLAGEGLGAVQLLGEIRGVVRPPSDSDCPPSFLVPVVAAIPPDELVELSYAERNRMAALRAALLAAGSRRRIERLASPTLFGLRFRPHAVQAGRA
jgi:hypothetical protein